jgi:TP901 family phage tail tape measure protein
MSSNMNLTVTVGADIANLTSGLRDATRAVTEFSERTRQTFEQLGKIGAGMTAIGVGIAGGLGLAANSAMDFEYQLSSIKAVSGATAAEMDKLSKLAVEMGAKTKYSATEAAQGIEELMKAGVSTADILGGGLQGALDLAVAGELELADAAEIASTALNAFKKDRLTVADAGNLLAGAANASATSVSEMKFGLSMVSAVAAGVGLSFKDTSTALAAFANWGLRGSDAGTSLKTMLLNLSPSTEAASEQMAELGLLTKEGNSAFYDANGSIKSMAEIAELLKTQLAGLTDEQRQLAMKTMFGTDAIRAANILYNEGAAGIDKMYESMSKVKAVDVATERLNNTKGAIEQLKGAFETASISLGTALLPAIKSITLSIQGMIDKFNGLSGSTKSTIAITAAIAAAFLLIAGPALMLIGFIPQIVLGFQALGTAATWLTGAIAGISSTVLIIVGVLAAIGVALVLAYKHVDFFRNGVDSAWSWIKSAWTSAVEFISGITKSVMSAVSSFISDRLGDITKWWSENGKAIMESAKFAFSFLKSYIQVAMGYISMIFQTIFPVIVGVVKIAWAVIQAAFSTAINFVLGLIGFFAKVFTGDFSGALESAKNTASRIWQNIVSIFKSINLADIGRNILQGLINGIKSMAGAVTKAVSGIASAIPSKIKSFLGIHSPSRVLMELGEFTGEGFVNGLKSMVNNVKAATEDMASAAVPSLAYETPVPSRVSLGTPSGIEVSQANNNGETNSLLRSIERKLTNLKVEMDGYEVGRIVEPHVDSIQASKFSTRSAMAGMKR